MKTEVNLCKEIRRDFGLTQVQFADRFGIPLRTVQGWESRRTMPQYIYNILSMYYDSIEKEAYYFAVMKENMNLVEDYKNKYGEL